MSKSLKRPADKDLNETSLSEPDIKKIRTAVALPVRYLGEGASGSGKNISWSVLQWTSEENGAPRKWPRQKDPIRNIEDVPAEWNWDPNDPDLEPCDIDANVKRCEERIEDGIMPQLFEIRLSTYKMLRAHRDKLIASEKKGLSLDVVKRLDSLKVIEKDLIANGDTWESLPNVRAIIKAYRSGELKWSRNGKATYWSHGKQICEPKIWDYDDIIKVNREHKGSKGFWVEGIDGPGPGGLFFVWTIRPEPNKLTFQHNVRFEVRVPPRMPGNKGPFWKGWKADFFDDTGSDTATIFEDDLEEILSLVPEGIDVPFIGDYQSQSIGGIVTNRNVVMQIRILSPGDNPITRWYPVRVTVYPTRHKEVLPHRLSGDWWRYVLYTANAPDNKGFIHASTMKEDLFKSIPDVDFSQAKGPRNIPGLGGEGLGPMPQGRIHTSVPEGILRGGTYVPRQGIVGGEAPTAGPSSLGGDAAGDLRSSGGAAPGHPPPHRGHLVPGVYFPPGTEGRASRPGMVPYGQYQGPWGASLVRPGDTSRTQRPVVAPEIPPGLGGWWLPRQLLYSPSPPASEGAGLSTRASQTGTRVPSMPGWEYWTPSGIVEGSSSSEGQSPPRTGEPAETSRAGMPGGSGGTAPPAGPQVVGPNGGIQPEAGWFWVPPGPGQAWPWGWYYRHPESEAAAAQPSAPIGTRAWMPPPWQQGWVPGPNGLTMGWVPSPGSVPAGDPGSIVYGGLGPTAGVPYQTGQQGETSRDQYWNNPYNISHGGGSSDTTRQLDPQATTFVPEEQVGPRTVIPRTAAGGTTGITPQLGRLWLAEAEEAPVRDWIAEGIPDPAPLPEWPTPLEASDTARQSRARRFARRFGRFVHGRKIIVPTNPANPPNAPS